MDEGREYSRGYLPHRDLSGATQFLTWRLLDAAQWAEWKARYPGEAQRADLYRSPTPHSTHTGALPSCGRRTSGVS